MIEHGAINIDWEDNFLIVHAQGAFNREGLMQAEQEIRQFLKSNPPTSTVWYRIDLLSASTLPTPESIPDINEMYAHSFQLGCGAAAVVTPFEKIIDFALRSHAGDSHNVHVFSDIDSAKRWLINQ